MKFEFSGQIFEKYSKVKLNGNPSSGRGGWQDGREDGHDEASIAFCNFANAPENIFPIFFSGATTHCGFVFCSPLGGYSLLAYEVSRSQTTTQHSR